MKGIVPLALACCAFFPTSDARAEALTPDQLERALFLSMMLSQDAEDSQLGVRILGRRYPNDDSVCDYIAERILKAPEAARPVSDKAIVWYVRTLGENCSARYRDALTLARSRYQDRTVLGYFDAALAVPVTNPVGQYAEGGVDLLAREAELQQQLLPLRAKRGFIGRMREGTPFGHVLVSAGVPVQLTALLGSTLAAHYPGTGILIFRRESVGGQWLLGQTLVELFPVAETYTGTQFAIAQSLACLRSRSFRLFVKSNDRVIRREPALLWALANRLSAAPVPSDRYEEDGMLVAVKVIASSQQAEAVEMLKRIGAAPGGKASEAARDYALKLEREAVPR